MKVKLFLFSVLMVLFCFSANILAEDLKIEEGKNDLDFSFKGYNIWYDDQQVYDNVTIGAGTSVNLQDEFQFVFLSSSTKTETALREVTDIIDDSDPYNIITATRTVQDVTNTTTIGYSKDENIATLSVAKEGTITLNVGSGLAIRNQYSLVTSTQDVSLKDFKVNDTTVRIECGYFSNETVDLYELTGYFNGIYDTYLNRELLDLVSIVPFDSANLFSGTILFGAGEGIEKETVLTFLPTSSDEVSGGNFGVLPPSPDSEIINQPTGAVITNNVVIEDKSVEPRTNDVAWMLNDFQVDTSRAVLDVIGTKQIFASLALDARAVVLLGDISGDGTLVKSGGGNMYLAGDATGLTGLKTGFSWRVEDGWLVAGEQQNLGSGAIYIDSVGSLGLVGGSIASIKISDFTQEVISGAIYADGFSNEFSNDMTFNGGELSLSAGTKKLTGDIMTTDQLGLAKFAFTGNEIAGAALILSGSNNAREFLIGFEGIGNYFITNADGLATESITATGGVADQFTLVLDQKTNAEYSGNLMGDMYLHKLGTGTLTLSGTNTYSKGTYISEGAVALTDAESIGTGHIMFNNGVRGSSTTYASLQVIEATSGNVTLNNTIYIDEGAIFNVYGNQTLTLLGDIRKFDATPGYEADFIKKGAGLLEIAKSSSTTNVKDINISTFTIRDGDFKLCEGVVLTSSFDLQGINANLIMDKDSAIRKNINISSGNLKIYNQANISSATVNFLNTSTSTLSSLYVSSNTILSTSTLVNQINVAKGLNFVNDCDMTAYANAFNFVSNSSNTILQKSGTGKFAFNVGSSDPYNLGELDVRGGQFSFTSTVSGSSVTVNISTIVVDGGILALKQGTYLTSSQSEIEIKTGGIGIYDETSIDPALLLNFNGTDPNNLARLIVEKSGANLISNIAISTGLIVQNEGTLTLTGTSVVGSSGIFGKDGQGTMIINNTDDFNIGEMRLIDGDMIVNNSTITVNTASILGGTLNIKENSVFDATVMNIQNAVLRGFGRINGTVNANTNSVIQVDGDVDNEFGTMTIGSINFNSGTTLNIDVNSSEESDFVNVLNNVQIANGANLYVNVIGDESEYADKKTYEIITAGNSLSILDPSNIGIFNTELSNLRLISNLYRSGRSIFLSLYQAFSEYELPGATKNQQAMLDVLNSIHANNESEMQDTLNKVDEAYMSGTEPFTSAMQDLSGIFYVNSFEASSLLSKVNMVYNRLADIGTTDRRIWAQAYTNNNSVAENSGNPKFENNVSGMIMGYDMLQEDDSLFGFSCFYGTGELKQLNDKADVIDFGANAYTVYNYEQFTVKGLAGLGIQNYDSTRTLNFINGNTINSKYSVNVISIDAEGIYNYSLNSYLTLKPFVGLNFAIVSNDSFEESSVYEQNLKIDASSYTKSEVRAGVGIGNNVESRFSWYASASVKQIVDGEKSKMTASFVNVPDEKFIIEGTELPKMTMSGNVGCSYDIGININVFIDLSSNMGSDLSSQTGTIGALYRW
ncbi:MAG: autotransporter domain-containing protein [Endomicrobiaceae bacterium]|nr:autotransporter domain-containing protein [Endomicrobiaceae bacterium]